MSSGLKPGGTKRSVREPPPRPRPVLRLLIFCLVPGLALTSIHQLVRIFAGEPLPTVYLAVAYVAPGFVLFLAGATAAELIALLPSRPTVFRIALLLCFAYAAAAAVMMIVRLTGEYDFRMVAPRLIPVFVVIVLSGTAAKRSLKGGYTAVEAGLFAALIVAASVGWLLFTPEEMFLPDFSVFPASALFLTALAGMAYRALAKAPGAGLAMSCVMIAVAAAVAAGLWTAGDGLELNAGFYRSPGVSGGPPEKDAPDIILIVWDTVRRDHLSLYGYDRPTTPHLEKFAEEGVVYTKAFSVAPWTLPSHASMFTGLYPRTHGAHHILLPGMTKASRDYRELGDDFVTLAERLTRNGYQCGGISANFFNVGRSVNIQQGFRYFDDRVNPDCMSMSLCELCNRFMKAVLPLELHFRHLNPSMVAGQVNELALKWLNVVDKDRPFFLFLNYMDAHTPYYPPPDLIRRFPGFQERLAPKTPPDILLRTVVENRGVSAAERAHFTSQYDAALVYLDEQLGVLETELRKIGLYEDSLVILTSDHGEFLGEHNLMGHDKALYSEVLAIPLIVKYPGSAITGTDDEIIENREIYRLVLDRLGICSKEPALPWDAAAELYSRFFRSREEQRAIKKPPYVKRAVLFGGYKLISSSDGWEELYDLDDDPAESENLAEKRKRARERGESMLKEFENIVPEFKNGRKDHKLGPGELKRLKALGYIR